MEAYETVDDEPVLNILFQDDLFWENVNFQELELLDEENVDRSEKNR
jgi:hypothetical protein